VIYQHPLAYLLALEGIALLRAFVGEYDRDFTHARIREVRRLVDDVHSWGDGISLPAINVDDGYQRWAESYDEAPNQLIDLEQPVVREILDRLPIGVALDVGCGTGRHTRYLADLGHRVIGIDRSPAMLARGRVKVPDASFHRADLHDLPLPDGCIDVLVCGLTLAHISELAPALTEFVRVLRPGGHLVISDSRGLLGYIKEPVVTSGVAGTPGYLPHRNRLTSDYLAAALPLRLQVVRCDEPRRPSPLMNPDAAPPGDAMITGPPNIWELHSRCAEATNAAYRENPAAIVWHFQLVSGP
jgi:ubiquinone/menaquinone biosynthesis C-methylase UbiE